jgi:DNA-binding GntR family transcriptional regulator
VLPSENNGNSDPALTERVADAIHARIVSGDWPAGTRLRQNALAAEFKVSRTPVREALKTLSERGVVEQIPHRGARVRLPTLRDLREAYTVRAVLEGLAAEVAADLATQDQMDRLLAAEKLFEEAVHAFAVDGDRGSVSGRSWHAANDAFHAVLHEASHNEVLRTTIQQLHRRFPRNLTWGVLSDLRLLTENVSQHRAIREAVERRDGVAARELMQAHIRRSGELLASRLTSLPSH